MNRRNNRRNKPNDILGGLDDLLDAWMDMMQVIPMMDTARNKVAQVATPKHRGTMSYEERDKDIVFTIDMPGVEKKDIDLNVDINSVSVGAKNDDREYSYSQDFSFSLNPKEVKATFNNGVLDIKIQKAEESKGNKIKIG